MKHNYLPRLAGDRVGRLLRQFPVVAVTGARQTGKTTLVQHLAGASDRTYRSLDDPDSLEAAVRDPDTFLAESPRLTLDEVQRRPELLSAIKRAVDRGRSAGRFLLTGSANLLMMARVSESLAGRAVYVSLRPLTEPEKAGRPDAGPWGGLMKAADALAARDAVPRAPRAAGAWARAVLEGGFPSAALSPYPASRSAWFDSYVATYVERDLRQLAQIDALVDFRRLMRIAALRTGRMVNQADMARDAGLSHATAHRYLNLLEASFLVARVPPYAVNRTKRLIKTPTLYWEDTGLAAHLAGIGSVGDLRRHECGGGLLENLVWHHLRCWADMAESRTEVCTWRTVSGEEVDFVIESGDRLLPIEVKSAARVAPGDIRHLGTFLDEYAPRARVGVVLYDGAECRPLDRRILAVPLSAALGLS
jgi:predicted AAA+ superfamily ATPase